MELLNAYPWLLAPAIFFARMLDVSLGTFRSIVVFRGYPALAAAIGFVEILIWLAAASQVLRQIDNALLLFSYAGGFACGNYVGIWLESKVAIGKELVRIISHRGEGWLSTHLKGAGHQVVSLNCEMDGRPAEVLLITANRRQTTGMLAAVRELDPDAEYTVSDIKSLRAPGTGMTGHWPLVPTGWRVRGKRK